MDHEHPVTFLACLVHGGLLLVLDGNCWLTWDLEGFLHDSLYSRRSGKPTIFGITYDEGHTIRNTLSD
jgi:hypothetical protein